MVFTHIIQDVVKPLNWNCMLAYVKQNNIWFTLICFPICMPDTQMPQEVHHLQGAGEYIDKSQCFWGDWIQIDLYIPLQVLLLSVKHANHTHVYIYTYIISVFLHQINLVHYNPTIKLNMLTSYCRTEGVKEAILTKVDVKTSWLCKHFKISFRKATCSSSGDPFWSLCVPNETPTLQKAPETIWEAALTKQWLSHLWPLWWRCGSSHSKYQGCDDRMMTDYVYINMQFNE